MKVYTELINNRIKGWRRHRLYALTAILGLMGLSLIEIIRNDDFGFYSNKMEYWGITILGFSLVQLFRYWSGIISFREHQLILQEHFGDSAQSPNESLKGSA
jgi:hypothetical protein